MTHLVQNYNVTCSATQWRNVCANTDEAHWARVDMQKKKIAILMCIVCQYLAVFIMRSNRGSKNHLLGYHAPLIALRRVAVHRQAPKAKKDIVMPVKPAGMEFSHGILACILTQDKDFEFSHAPFTAHHGMSRRELADRHHTYFPRGRFRNFFTM